MSILSFQWAHVLQIIFKMPLFKVGFLNIHRDQTLNFNRKSLAWVKFHRLTQLEISKFFIGFRKFCNETIHHYQRVCKLLFMKLDTDSSYLSFRNDRFVISNSKLKLSEQSLILFSFTLTTPTSTSHFINYGLCQYKNSTRRTLLSKQRLKEISF